MSLRAGKPQRKGCDTFFGVALGRKFATVQQHYLSAEA